MIIKTIKHLGDTIHAYCVISNLNKTDNKYKLFTNPNWWPLFSPDVLINYLDNTVDYLSLDGDPSPIKYPMGFRGHARDKIAELFNCENPQSIRLVPTADKFINKLVVICENSSKEYKDWTGNWDCVETMLIDLGFIVVRSSDIPDIEKLAQYIDASCMVISVDTAIVHMADCYNKPVIGLYGATNVNIFGPYTESKYCITRRYMADITPDDIICKVNQVIKDYDLFAHA